MKDKSLQYVLSPVHTGNGMPKLSLQIFAKNEQAQLRSINIPYLFQTMDAYSEADQQLLHWLQVAHQQKLLNEVANHYCLLEGHFGSQLLPALISSKRAHWLSTQNPIITQGQARASRLEWEPVSEGLKKFKCSLSGQTSIIFKLNPFWYFDQRQHEFGLVNLTLPYEVVNRLLSAPPLKDQQIKTLYAALGQPHLEEKMHYAEGAEAITLLPQIQLCMLAVNVENRYDPLQTLTVNVPAIRLMFNYGGKVISPSYAEDTLILGHGKKTWGVPRDRQRESEVVKDLLQSGLILLKKSALKPTHLDDHDVYFVLPEGNADWLGYHLKKLPLFKEQQWQILINPDYPYQFAEQSDLEWYTKFDEGSSHQWFDMELGIFVQGQKINLLPLIIHAIENYFTEHEQAASLPDDGYLLTKLPDGRLFPIPVIRIKPILHVLTELFDKQHLNKYGKLRLSRVRAAQLLAVERSIQKELHMRWWGADRIQQLAVKLQHFDQLAEVKSPENLKASLRPYQQEGLNWLQFLSAYELGGILADDMGLGKTIQALAHILLEKEKGHLKHPCLIVSPTTLITNWKVEAEKFCPDLRVLVLHGASRQEHFKKMHKYDLVLTTYPLIVRDYEILSKQPFYLLVLDEAQLIKNSRSKAALMINKLNAMHRLCLTGTPLENHLGELWSLFSFLMPGFLGDRKHFSRFFKTPIEKYDQQEKIALLRERLSPFVLRRTKASVALELPPKNEIVSMIELEMHQRDLYESVRLALNAEVQLAIEKNGWNNSQFIVLDALLKLRQICCDPRLLKLESAQKAAAGSAKLQYLVETLPSLMEEGRHVLLFSQFTEMLGLIEEEVKRLGISYVKLTGQTQDRQTPINLFQEGKVPLFLISLKAGGLGLNLTAADTVIHYDPWWNPAVERQATDRAHRIGQNKSVFVYKLIMAGTVEEKILALQEQKQQWLDILQVDQSSGSPKVTVEQLKKILEYL